MFTIWIQTNAPIAFSWPRRWLSCVSLQSTTWHFVKKSVTFFLEATSVALVNLGQKPVVKKNFVEIVFVNWRSPGFRNTTLSSWGVTHTFEWFTWASCTACCKRWFFTFNNAECSDPAPIDGSLYQNFDLNIHRPTKIEGNWVGFLFGKVRVGFSIGKCDGGANTNADAWTSWNQANRIIIEDVEPPVD